MFISERLIQEIDKEEVRKDLTPEEIGKVEHIRDRILLSEKIWKMLGGWSVKDVKIIASSLVASAERVGNEAVTPQTDSPLPD